MGLVQFRSPCCDFTSHLAIMKVKAFLVLCFIAGSYAEATAEAEAAPAADPFFLGLFRRCDCRNYYTKKCEAKKEQQCETTYHDACRTVYREEKECTKIPQQSCHYVN